MSADIRIGTSGWHYKHWRGNFYPESFPATQMLALYQQRFDTLELNNTFYRLPSETAVEGWRNSTPEYFQFAVKGSRYLTHMKKLKDPEAGLDRFFGRVGHLREKLGPILFQLPPQWEIDVERLAYFLRVLPRHRYAFEFRNQTWNTPEIMALLRSHQAAYCAYHLAGYESPIEITTDFAYIRLHGPGGKYQGSYDDGALRRWADKIRGWRQHLEAVYVYFDNDDSGYAARDAQRLRAMIFG